MDTILYKEYFDRIKKDGIDRYVLQFNNMCTLFQYKKAYEISLRYLKKGDCVLDWGCGQGHFSYFLTVNGIKTVGYSLEPWTAPAFLNGNNLFEHFGGKEEDSTRLPFENGKFDVVFSVGVLEHVHEVGGKDIDSTREIFRILKPGGRFICFHLPNRYQLIENAGRIVGRLEHFHSKKYSVRDIKELLSSSNMVLEDHGRYGILPRNQMRKMPSCIKNSYSISWTLDVVDRLLGGMLPILCTNHYFVARKRP